MQEEQVSKMIHHFLKLMLTHVALSTTSFAVQRQQAIVRKALIVSKVGHKCNVKATLPAGSVE